MPSAGGPPWHPPTRRGLGGDCGQRAVGSDQFEMQRIRRQLLIAVGFGATRGGLESIWKWHLVDGRGGPGTSTGSSGVTCALLAAAAGSCGWRGGRRRHHNRSRGQLGPVWGSLGPTRRWLSILVSHVRWVPTGGSWPIARPPAALREASARESGAHTHTHRTQLKAAKRGKRDSADCYRCLVRLRKTNCPWNERGVGGASADRFAGANRRERHTWRGGGSGREGKERGERGEREMQRREKDRTTPFAQEDPSRNTRRETRKGDKRHKRGTLCVEYARGSFSFAWHAGGFPRTSK